MGERVVISIDSSGGIVPLPSSKKVRRQLVYAFEVNVGGGWGRVSGRAEIYIPRSVLERMESAVINVASGLASPPGGGFRVTFNGVEVPYQKSTDVTGITGTENLIAIDIWGPMAAWWIGDTTVRGNLAITCVFPDEETASAAFSEAKELLNLSKPTEQQPGFSFSVDLMTVVSFLPMILIFIMALVLIKSVREAV